MRILRSLLSITLILSSFLLPILAFGSRLSVTNPVTTFEFVTKTELWGEIIGNNDTQGYLMIQYFTMNQCV